MTSGASATNSAANFRVLSAFPGRAIVNQHVVAIGPAELLQHLAERRHVGLQVRIVGAACAQEHTDAPVWSLCCAFAVSGNTDATPPRTPRNSRRFMQAPLLRRQHRALQTSALIVAKSDVREADIRFGSLTDLVPWSGDDCFTPESGHQAVRLRCRLSANSGHRRLARPRARVLTLGRRQRDRWRPGIRSTRCG